MCVACRFVNSVCEMVAHKPISKEPLTDIRSMVAKVKWVLLVGTHTHTHAHCVSLLVWHSFLDGEPPTLQHAPNTSFPLLLGEGTGLCFRLAIPALLA